MYATQPFLRDWFYVALLSLKNETFSMILYASSIFLYKHVSLTDQ